jgi:MFS family permease
VASDILLSNEVNLRRSRLTIALVVFVDLLGFGILIPMLPFFVRSFGLGAFELGLLMSIYSVLQIFAAPFWGKLSDRWGRRPILLLTIGGQGLSFLLAAFSTSYEMLFVSRMLAGLFAGNISTASAYMADITSSADRAKGMGLIGAAFGLGFTLGPAISGIVLPLGYAFPSLVAATLSAVNLVGAYFFLKEPERDREARSHNRRKIHWELLWGLISKPITLRIILVFFLMTFAFVQLEINLALFVVDVFFFSETQAVYLLAGFGVLMALVQGAAVGPFVGSFGEKKVFFMGVLGMALGLLLVSQTTSQEILLMGLGIVALGYSFSNPCLAALLSKNVNQNEQGSYLGIYHSGGSLARAGGPLLAGWAFQAEKRLPFLIAFTILLLIAMIWFHWIWTSRVKEN